MKRTVLLAVSAIAMTLPWSIGPAAAADANDEQAQAYQRMLEDAERARIEAETARQEARSLSERAREMARQEAERERREAEKAVENAEERALERAARSEEMERVREELSRTHRELREASREIARAHRELARVERDETLRVLNLGDRAVIGVVLGPAGPDGVELIAVSPGGPAEKAGIEAGDRLVTIAGEDLRDAAGRGRLFEIMGAAEPGDELEIVVERDGQTLPFTVEAELREPSSWQSIVRIPEIADIESAALPEDPVLPADPEIVIERIHAAEIDEEALQQKMEELRERLEHRKFIFVDPEGGSHAWSGDFDFDVEAFSGFADNAFAEADVFFGLPTARGLEFATMNAGLGAYFGSDRGVLVLQANADNAYGLQAGDVILAVADESVDTPAELLRALRRAEPGQDLSLDIKRNRQDQTLRVTMPENRLGLR